MRHRAFLLSLPLSLPLSLLRSLPLSLPLSLLLSLLLLLLPALAYADDAPRRIALSFDDAPTAGGALFSGPQRTAAIIAALADARAPQAAVFVTTRNIDGPDDLARLHAYVEAGHVLGNHSHAHGWLSRMPFADWVADLDRARGQLAALPGTRPWYRYPFLDEGRSADLRDQARAALAERGLSNGYVTVDTYDWYLAARTQQAAQQGLAIDYHALRRLYLEMLVASVGFYDAIARDALGRSPVHVLLLHENDLAALFVGDLVRALRAAGWSLVDIDTAYADPIASELPRTTFQGQGRVAALAHDRGRKAPTLVHASEDEAWIDAAIESRRVFATAR